MKLKVDENLPIEVAEVLRQAGHDALTVHDQRLTGHADDEVAAICRAETRVLVTLDTDFTNIQRYPPADYRGLIVLRLGRQDKPYVLAMMTTVVKLLQSEPIDRQLWIVEDGRVRIRGAQ